MADIIRRAGQAQNSLTNCLSFLSSLVSPSQAASCANTHIPFPLPNRSRAAMLVLAGLVLASAFGAAHAHGTVASYGIGGKNITGYLPYEFASLAP